MLFFRGINKPMTILYHLQRDKIMLLPLVGQTNGDCMLCIRGYKYICRTSITAGTREEGSAVLGLGMTNGMNQGCKLHSTHTSTPHTQEAEHGCVMTNDARQGRVTEIFKFRKGEKVNTNLYKSDMKN